MKERPIIFKGEMVRAILEGRKTQTRRVIKPQPEFNGSLTKGVGERFWDFGWCYYWPSKNYVHTWDDDGNGGQNWTGSDYPKEDVLAEALKVSPSSKKCPYGMPGDRLWVRETFADVNTDNGPAITYKANDGVHFCSDDAWPVEYDRYPGKSFTMWIGDLHRGEDGHCWTPSIHMPRWASRILLEITNVRVERLQDISVEDSEREGCSGVLGDLNYYWQGRSTAPCPRAHFCGLWESINGVGSWDQNPWVWVIEFKVVKP